MAIDGLIEFTSDDQAYLHWLSAHPDGNVINTPRSKTPSYMTLHRATCQSISEYTGRAMPGGFTERDYIKICSDDLDTLKRWVRQHGRPDGSFSSKCACTKDYWI